MIIINLNNLNELLIEKSKKNFNSKGFSIGSIIKKKRNEKRQTLEEVCKQICCVGFLSKLERNKVDTVENNPIVIKLCERLDLDYEEISSVKTNNNLLDTINDFAFFKYENIKNRFESLNTNLFLSQNALIECLYYLISEEYNKLNILINKLDSVKQTFNSLELSVLLFILIYYYIKTFQYKNALNYLNLELLLDIDNIAIKILESEAKFLISTQIERSSVEADYIKIKSFYETGYSLVKQFLLRLEYLKTIDVNNAYKVLCSLEKEKLSTCITQFYYTKCYILLELDKNKECLELIIDKKLIACNFIALFSFALFKLIKNKSITIDEKIHYKKILFNLIKDTKYLNEDNLHLAFVKLMQYEIDESTNVVICNYIKEQMLPALEKFQYYIYYEYIIKRYYQLVGELFRYKDSYIILGKMLNKELLDY